MPSRDPVAAALLLLVCGPGLGCSASGSVSSAAASAGAGNTRTSSATAAASSGGATGGKASAGSSSMSSSSSSGGKSSTGSSGGQTSGSGRATATTATTGGGAPALGHWSGALRVDNIGWRTGDSKIAVLLGAGGVPVQLVAQSSNAVVGTYQASGLRTEANYSNDSYALVDFSAFATPGDYYLYVPSLAIRSYGFRIADDVYDIVGAVAAKAFYFQRCNHDKALPYAGDGLGTFAGLGGQWVDAACHPGDTNAAAGPGSADHGALDLHGGWHDAGDYQKTLWARGVAQLLFAYEVNPTTWTDGQLNLPESANGIPDLLDQVKWELDFYLRMQRPDGHFLTSVKGNNATVSSPPSAANETRVYFDATSPSGNGWSGGGVSTATATANAVLALAHAAIVFRAIGQTVTGDGYAAAATSGWGWLSAHTLSGPERQIEIAAASAIYRMDGTNQSAQQFVEAAAWDTFDGFFPGGSPGEAVLSLGAWHYLMNPAATPAVKTKMQTAILSGIVAPAFAADGPYAGMNGNSTNGWDWSWGSNRNQATYGANLLMAAKLGIVGSHTAGDLAARGLKHLHYLLGLNPLNMLYLTNMAAYGGEHSSFHIFHSWFSLTANDGDHGNVNYNGKPATLSEPAYPYYADDSQTSLYGPAPGLMPGGPNWYYDATYTIPNRQWPAYAYRDFSVGCGWNGSACTAASWELTEPDVSYQGPAVWLLSFAM